jgi:probable rRNA maturation factor
VPADASVTLAFVDESRIRELNHRYRGLTRVTDVLSFGHALPPGVRGRAAVERLPRESDGSLELGDVVVCSPVAVRQARRRRRSLPQEVALLVAHGGLHLIGYEDETPAGYRLMRRLGDEAVLDARKIVGQTTKS